MVSFRLFILALFANFFLCTLAQAGLYYSAESFTEFPCQWRGFLLDHRALRHIAVQPMPGNPPSPLRLRYLEDATRLEKKSALTAEEQADLGALHLRLGNTDRALTILRQAQQKHPDHFRILANLGTAWQKQGDLAQAALSLHQGIRHAPKKLLPAEELHLKLVQARLRQGPKNEVLDDLFGLRYLGEKGEFEPGKIAAAEKKKLPAQAVGLVQQLALWLPGDGRLLWQLAELANAHGDITNAAAMMDGCVTTLGMGNLELRRHRQLVRAAVELLPPAAAGIRSQHEKGHGAILFRSKRALENKLSANPTATINATGINLLPWEILAQTRVNKNYQPNFPRYLHDLAGKQVSLTGFMQPLRDESEVARFMFIEFPVGCWFCETPETSGILYVELPPGETTAFRRTLVRVTGRLDLNATDPEDFMYAIRDARVGGVD